MPLPLPILDDRKYEDIVQEARTRIPRYTSEWTDFNDSDPGMTLLQLFAWMTDMLLYRLNQVPELNYRKFLQLLGIQLRPAQSAQVDLTFQLNRPDTPTALIPQGTRVAGPGSPPMVFETAETLSAVGPILTAALVFDGFAYDDVSKANSKPGGNFFAFGRHAHEKSALLLGFDSPSDFPNDLIDLMVYVHTEVTSPIGVQCGIDISRIKPPATVDWQYLDGSTWKPLLMESDATRAFTKSGHVRVRLTDAAPKMAKQSVGGLSQPLYWLRAYLHRSQYDRPPQLEQVVTNTIAAIQAVTLTDEVLGGSNGQPRQTFRLATAPVLVLDKSYSVPGVDGKTVEVRSVLLEVDEGGPSAADRRGAFLAWQEVDDFFRSGPADPHFTVDHTTGDVLFGDGRRGRIPLPNPANPSANIVARRYRSGGGIGGNLGSGTITALRAGIPGVQSVTNLRPAIGGAEQESIDDAKLRAPAELKSRERAVTADDFELLAIKAPGANVARAKAVPLYDPRYADIEIPGVVTVIVVPASDQVNPIPNETTLTTVCAQLNRYRLLTSEVHVVPPTYNRVRITVDAVAKPQADVATVTNAILKELAAYLSPLTGGDSGNGWDFGGTIYYSKLYRRILDLPGVDRIENNALVIEVDGHAGATCEDVPIGRYALVYTIASENKVNVSYGAGAP
jgi:predicted phage baseplate assembly protein